mmetsp:Transcript_35759/g.71747  ORF Transcript_35759/g.71747 Transcript_35759/m.71747 type:complete len:274 (-) Transcript_35759:136-957(-)
MPVLSSPRLITLQPSSDHSCLSMKIGAPCLTASAMLLPGVVLKRDRRGRPVLGSLLEYTTEPPSVTAPLSMRESSSSSTTRCSSHPHSAHIADTISRPDSSVPDPPSAAVTTSRRASGPSSPKGNSSYNTLVATAAWFFSSTDSCLPFTRGEGASPSYPRRLPNRSLSPAAARGIGIALRSPSTSEPSTESSRDPSVKPISSSKLTVGPRNANGKPCSPAGSAPISWSATNLFGLKSPSASSPSEGAELANKCRLRVFLKLWNRPLCNLIPRL